MPRHVVWEWLDRAGLEHLVLSVVDEEVRADGMAVIDLGAGASVLRYTFVCDGAWRIRSAAISLHHGAAKRAVTLDHDGAGLWRVDGAARPDLDGCSEVDLQGTPFTNTLPIRRLAWRAGEAQTLRVAYVLVPSLEVEAGEQEYTRLDPADPPRRFRYGNPGSGFSAELALDEDGLVVDYPPYWRRRAR